MKKWDYSVSTNTIWLSFDYGTVEAETIEEAKKKAKEEISYNLNKANEALEHCDNTKGFTIEIDLDNIEIKLKN